MKRILRSLWPEGYIFMFFCAVFICGAWLFGRVIVTNAEAGNSGITLGLIAGAVWAWLMGKVSEAMADSGKEWIKRLTSQ